MSSAPMLDWLIDRLPSVPQPIACARVWRSCSTGAVGLCRDLERGAWRLACGAAALTHRRASSCACSRTDNFFFDARADAHGNQSELNGINGGVAVHHLARLREKRITRFWWLMPRLRWYPQETTTLPARPHASGGACLPFMSACIVYATGTCKRWPRCHLPSWATRRSFRSRPPSTGIGGVG